MAPRARTSPHPVAEPQPASTDLRLPQAMVDPGSLHPHPENYRRHDQGILRESLDTFGQYAPVVVNRGTQTGRPDEIIKGHGTVRAFKETQAPGSLIQVSYVDVDEDTARKILAMDNRSTALGADNDVELYALLSRVEGLAGTGYVDEDVETLRRLIEATAPPGDETNPVDEWWDMPEIPETLDGVKPYRKIIVAFLNEDDVKRFAEAVGGEFTDKTKSIWFPHRAEIRHQKGYRVVGADEAPDDE